MTDRIYDQQIFSSLLPAGRGNYDLLVSSMLTLIQGSDEDLIRSVRRDLFADDRAPAEIREEYRQSYNALLIKGREAHAQQYARDHYWEMVL